MEKNWILAVVALAAIVIVGAVVLTQNQPVLPLQNQDRVQADGTLVKADGTMVKPDGTMIKPDGIMVKPDGTMILPDGTLVEPNQNGVDNQGNAAGEPSNTDSTDTDNGAMMKKSSYEPFSKTKFDQARASGKRIFLYFYANWCPICKTQEPTIAQAFGELPENLEIAGFRVNYNDSETDSDEQDLARQFGITYQHSYVILDQSGNVALKEIGAQWSKETTIQKLISSDA